MYYLHNVCPFSIQVNRNSNKVAVFLDNLCKVSMTSIHKNMGKKISIRIIHWSEVPFIFFFCYMDMLMLINIQTFDTILPSEVVAVAFQVKDYFCSSLYPLSFSYVVAPSTVKRTQRLYSTTGSHFELKICLFG